MQILKPILLFILFFCATEFCFAQELSYDEVIEVTNKVKQEEKFIGVLSETQLHTLPIGIIKQIGETKYIIAIDSAYFTPQGAFFNAYMAIEFPGTDKKIAFAAKRIKFNPSGVIGGNQSRLMLVSDHRFAIGNHCDLHLSPNGNNFIEWNCNGFSGIHLSGEFIFSSQFLINAQDQNLPVTATFSVFAENIHEAITAVSFSEFKIRGLNDWTFEVDQAIVDWSSLLNPSQIIFPENYLSEGNLWTGFWLKEFSVTLPEEFSKPSGPTKISAQNLIIDEQGLSGIFSAQSILDFGEGNMSGWKFSLDELQMTFVTNELIGGGMSGSVHLPVMDTNQSILFSAMLFYNHQNQVVDYSFSIQAAENIQFPVLGARVDIYPSSQLICASVNHQFKPSAILNGKIKFGNDDFSTGKLEFERITLIAESPYLIDGLFSFSSGENKLANYPVTINTIYLDANSTAPSIGIQVSLNLMDEINQGISANSIIQIKTQIQEVDDKQRLKFKEITIGSLAFSVSNSVFNLAGQITFRKNDPIYGKGFYGNLNFSIPGVFEPGFSASACFGKTTFRYFALDAFIPVQFPIAGTPIEIKRFMGGISYHMQPQKASASQYVSTIQQTPSQNFTQLYYPNSFIGLGFKAGVTFSHIPNEKTVNGDALLEMLFTSSGGLSTIQFTGNAYFLCKISDRLTKPANTYGSVSILYDHLNRSFDATINAQLSVPNAVSGSGEAKIHFDPTTWLVCIGRPSLPLSVSIINLAGGTAYLMAGKQLEPMPPPPAQLNGLVNSLGLNQLRNNTALEDASGFACGFRFSGGMYREMGWDDFKVYGSFNYGAGFDMMLANYGSNAHCSGYSNPIGINGWMVEGQIFAYLQCNIGIIGKILGDDFDLTILNGSVAALLGGKLPKPTYLYGGINCNYSILNLINGSFTFQFESGTNCSIVQG